MPHPKIRTFHEDDRDVVVALWSIAFPDDPPWNASNALIDQKLTVQPELFFVCELEGELVGTTLAGYDGVRGWVHKVACHPDQRQQGVAQALMSHAEKALADMGCVKLNLQVRQGNDSAAAFYEAIGFEKEQRINYSKRLTK